MRLFRKKRKNNLKKGKFGTYLRYALGEIVIVVLGILIAIQLNNWNTRTNDRQTIQDYYSRIRSEIATTSEIFADVESFNNESTLPDLLTAQAVISGENMDSLAVLNTKLKWLTDADVIPFRFPVLMEFDRKGYLSTINDPELNDAFLFYNYCQSKCDIANHSKQATLTTLIQPYLLKHHDYASLDYYNLTEQGAPLPIQEALSNDVYLLNLTSLVISQVRDNSLNFSELGRSLQRLDEVISVLQDQ